MVLVLAEPPAACACGRACPRGLAAKKLVERPVVPGVRGLASVKGGFQAGFLEVIMAHFTIH